MGKFADKFLNLLRIDDDEDYDEDYDDFDEEEDIKPAVRKSAVKESSNREKETKFNSTSDFEQSPQRNNFKTVKQSKVVPMTRSGSRNLEVCVIKPSTVEDSREITDTLLSGRAVVLNLEGIHVDVAQRIIDFASGSCYSISGNLQKISNYIFLITPESVDISGDFQDLLGGSFDVAAFK